MRIAKIYQPSLHHNCKIETQPTTHKYSAHLKLMASIAVFYFLGVC